MTYKSLEQWERQRSHMLVLMAFQQLMNGINYFIIWFLKISETVLPPSKCATFLN